MAAMLSERGVVYGLDLLSNVRGGLRTGTINQGKLHGILNPRLEQAAGWQGLSGFVNFFQIHNTGRIKPPTSAAYGQGKPAGRKPATPSLPITRCRSRSPRSPENDEERLAKLNRARSMGSCFTTF
jgi:hypothetical protein